MTYAERNFFWKIFNQTLRGQVTLADEADAWEKITEDSASFTSSKEAIENARSAEQEKRERQLQVNDLVAWIGMKVIIVFLVYFFCKIFYIKIIIPFLDWYQRVLVWLDNHQTVILFWVGACMVSLICYRIFPIVKRKK
jgi:hypothetical protein